MNHTITSPKDHTFIFISLQKEEKKKTKNKKSILYGKLRYL